MNRRIQLLLLLSCAVLALETVPSFAKPYTWRRAGIFPPKSFNDIIACAYFWNNESGIIGDTGSYYTRDGKTWKPSLVPKDGAYIPAIRSFDGRILFAPTSFGEIWTSTDSGASWKYYGGCSPLATDVYYDPSAQAVVGLDPKLGTTIATMDGTRWVVAVDDTNNVTPRYTDDGGATWRFGTFAPGNGTVALQGYSVWADRANKIFYAIGEGRTKWLQKSTDFGFTWSILNTVPNPLPIAAQCADDIEGSNGHLYIQTSVGLYRTDDGAATWDSLGGPILGDVDDIHFCVFGCNGLSVVAWDRDGGVWIGNENDGALPPALHSSFVTSARECSSDTVRIHVDSALVPGLMRIVITNDSDGVFSVIGSDTVMVSGSGTDFAFRFESHDVRNHTATISLVPIEYVPCSTHFDTIRGRATLAKPSFAVPPVTVGCLPVTTRITIDNPNCDSIRISRVTLSPAAGTIYGDSVLRGTDSLQIRLFPLLQTGTQSYPIHLEGTYRPSGVPFDTIISLPVTYGHIFSQMVTPSSAFDFGTRTTCEDFADTVITLENNGCDTLRVPLRQTLGTGWRVTPASDTLTIYPGQTDTLRVRYDGKTPGTFTQHLSYVSIAPRPNTISVDLQLTIIAAVERVDLTATSIDLGKRSFCASDTTLFISLQNLSCDSSRISNMRLTGDGNFFLLHSLDTVIPPNGAIRCEVFYHGTHHGVSASDLTIHSQHLDGSHSIDTNIRFAANVTRGDSALEVRSSGIDVGRTSICTERDTFIVLRNPGCDTLCIANMTISNPSFAFHSGQPLAFCLAPGELDTIPLRTILDTSGHATTNSSSLNITIATNEPFIPIPLTRGIVYPVEWSIAIGPPDTAGPGSTNIYSLMQIGTLPPNVTDLDFTLVVDDDMLDYLDAAEINVALVNSTRSTDGRRHLHFHVSRVSSAPTLATLRFRSLRAIASSTPVYVETPILSADRSILEACTVNVHLDSSAFVERSQCGSSFLQSSLADIPLHFDGIGPNPTSDVLLIRMNGTLPDEHNAMLCLDDGLGRTLRREMISPSADGGTSVTWNLSSLPSGFYTVRLETATGRTLRRIVKE